MKMHRDEKTQGFERMIFFLRIIFQHQIFGF